MAVQYFAPAEVEDVLVRVDLDPASRRAERLGPDGVWVSHVGLFDAVLDQNNLEWVTLTPTEAQNLAELLGGSLT